MNHEPTNDQDVRPPKREHSGLIRRGSTTLDQYTAPPPKKSRSVLQRMGVAPITGHEEAPDVPRSPTGAIRSHSALTRRIMDKEKAKVQADAAAADMKGENFVPEVGQDWHYLPLEELYSRLVCPDGINGLSDEEAATRLVTYGKNLITPPPQRHWLIKVLLLLVGGFQLMMFGGGILCFIVYGISKATDVQSLALGIVLVVVVFASAAFQYYQEGKADSVMDSLRALTAESVFVVRNGETKQIPAETLVPGDIVKVNSGEKVPADIRILDATDLKVNNAPLTGENIDIKLGANANHKLLYEAKNIARSGCNFTSGNGCAVVFLTGDNTFFGSIAKSATAVEHPDTLMKREIRRLIMIMAIVAFTLGITFFILSQLNGYSWVESVLFLIGIAVANVPEGLLPQLTVALSLTAQRLHKVGVLVTNLEIIETLGAVTVICSDKTGTLTCNRMTVAHLVYDKKIWLASEDSPMNDTDNFTVFDRNSTFAKLHRNLTLNTDAIFMQSEEAEPDVLNRDTKGDASESAMIKFVHPLRDIVEYRNTNPRLAAIPFNSSNKWMLSINEDESDPNSKPLTLMIKGAPEKILSMCTSMIVDGNVEPMSSDNRNTMEDLNMNLGKRGERVIAMAYSELDRSMFPKGFDFETDPPNFPTGGLTMIGYVAMIDPPRPSVRDAIENCHTAGVKVIMVTGDHPITARSIAKSLNMITKLTKEELLEEGKEIPENYHDTIVVHGSEMENYSQDDWDHVLAHDEIVFARTMPQQKQDIVNQLTAIGHVVAMTGDGVNDAPALKSAHVGIAMYSGAAVAKEAAQVVLLNDDFGAIVDGVMEGRLIFDNLKKCICYVLSSNVPEIIPFLLFITIKIPLAIETIVILTIDLGTDLAPAVSIAFEGPEDSIMMRPPRSPDQHMVGLQMMMIAYGTIGLFQTFIAFFAWCWVFIDKGFTLDQLRDSGAGWRDKYEELDDVRQDHFTNMCNDNKVYLKTGGNCESDFQKYRNEVIGEAQACYLAAVVWAQVGNLFIRKTQVASVMTKSRLLDNHVMLFSILSEFIIVFCLIYIPGLNTAFMMSSPSIQFVFCSIWAIPFIVMWDETRKWLCRRDLTGFWNLYTNF